jgi:archaellum biogenesis protein FlaJ (TadC family)
MYMADITSEDRERVKLLSLISSSKHEFDKLSLEQLARLEELVKKKDYSHDKKADKTKSKFLKRINVRIYEITEGRGIWG